MPAGFAPFNVYGIGPLLLVTYAKQDEAGEDDVKGPGNGFVDVFSAEGFFLQRLISGGHLNSPWGLVFAPDNDKGAIDLAGRQLRRRHDQRLQPVAEGASCGRALGRRAGRHLGEPAGDRRVVGPRVRLGREPASRRTRSISPPVRTTRRTACSAASRSSATAAERRVAFGSRLVRRPSRAAGQPRARPDRVGSRPYLS